MYIWYVYIVRKSIYFIIINFFIVNFIYLLYMFMIKLRYFLLVLRNGLYNVWYILIYCLYFFWLRFVGGREVTVGEVRNRLIVEEFSGILGGILFFIFKGKEVGILVLTI